MFLYIQVTNERVNMTIPNVNNVTPKNPINTEFQTQTTVSSTPVIVAMVDERKQRLCTYLGISFKQYDMIVTKYPEFPNWKLDKQLEIVSAYKNQNNAPANTSTTDESGIPLDTSQYSYENYDQADYTQKNNMLITELAHNIFVHGYKDENGNEIIPKSSEEAWNSMSPEQRQAFVNEKIGQNPNLKNLQSEIAEKTDNTQRTDLMDASMRAIQVANSRGISVVEFMALSEYERLDIIENYLEGLQKNGKLSSSDEQYLTRQDGFMQATAQTLKEKYNIELPADIKASELEQYINDYNLNRYEEFYNYCSKKDNSAQQNADLNKLKELMTSDAGRDILTKSKAARLTELQNEFNALDQRSNELTPAEQAHYNRLKDYLNSDEAKELATYKLPEPKNEYELQVNSDINNFRKQLKGYVNGTELETAGMVEFIERKTKDMSPEEKGNYIATFLKFNNDITSVGILGRFGNEISSLYENKYLLSEGALNTANMDTPASDVYDATLLDALQNNDNLVATNAAITRGEIYASPACADASFDDRKTNFVTKVVPQSTNAEVQTTAYNAVTTITDANLQGVSIERLQTSENATDELQVYAADNADRLHAQNQIRSLEIATGKSANATARAAENGITARMAKENQVEAGALIHQNINNHFEGEDAIRYSNALADQIQHCDKDNQLAMHENMMTSKYSEVQEHAAGNIKNYDPSVQPDAMSSVYSSGNQKAIETAVASISEFKSPDVQQIVVKQAVMELASLQDADLSEKFANGTLTRDEISQLSTTERREYYIRLFEQASPADKIKYLKDIPAGRNKQTIYNVIGTYYKNLFIQMIQDDVQTAEIMYNMGLKTQLHNIVVLTIIEKAETDPSFKFLRDRLGLSSEKEQPQVEEEYPPTARTLKFASVPNGLSNGFNSDEFALFPKDRYGNLLA